MKKQLLIKTAFACMACDGCLDAREVECVRQFIQNDNLYLESELKIELDKLVDEFNLDANTFMSQFFSDLHNTDLTEDDQLKIIEYAVAIIRTDEEIDYMEIKFFKIIKTKCGIRLNLFLHLALPILHQPLRHYRYALQTFGESSIFL